MNLSDVTAGEFLASNDYLAGTVFPLREIVKIEEKDVGIPGKREKQRKCVIFLQGAPKGWVANKQCLRVIGAALGVVINIHAGWIGARVALFIDANVKRPDGTKGNAFRIKDVQPAAKPQPQQEKEVIK